MAKRFEKRFKRQMMQEVYKGGRKTNHHKAQRVVIIALWLAIMDSNSRVLHHIFLFLFIPPYISILICINILCLQR